MDADKLIKLIQDKKTLGLILSFDEKDFIEPEETLMPCEIVFKPMTSLEKIAYSLYRAKSNEYQELTQSIIDEYEFDGANEEVWEKLKKHNHDDFLIYLGFANEIIIQKNFFYYLLWGSICDDINCAYFQYFDIRKGWFAVLAPQKTCGSLPKCAGCINGQINFN